jgi:transcriptional regulator with XRE-family HTH domain
MALSHQCRNCRYPPARFTIGLTCLCRIGILPALGCPLECGGSPPLSQPKPKYRPICDFFLNPEPGAAPRSRFTLTNLSPGIRPCHPHCCPLSYCLCRRNPLPKEKPQVNIGEVIKTYRSQRGLSQGDIERRTGLLRCYLSRVENGHTVPSLETLAKIAEAMEISLADFFPGTETPRDKETQKMLGELSQDEIRFLAEIKKYSTTLSEGDKRLVLAMIRKMATLLPAQAAQAKKVAVRRPSL